ncbi:hypothetical protein FX985_02891 [Pseudomonas extremaustralis]|uniref:Uncharacterized protein n=1 Tax=Pseudomonas extremaustralis TaxID=359110 RepID=A0A5M9J4Z4_9PSED|nr:hypothetical protein FX985_02891 [Pseudomonas extremaustralis]
MKKKEQRKHRALMLVRKLGFLRLVGGRTIFDKILFNPPLLLLILVCILRLHE